MLLNCIIATDETFLTLRPNAAHIHDASTLACKHEVKYNNALKEVEVSRLSYYGSTSSHSSFESSSCLGPFIVSAANIPKFGCKSVNNENPSKDGSNKDFNTLIARFKLNAEETSIEFYNQATESMIIQQEFLGCIVEYAPNKLFAGAKPTCMFLIDDWVNIRCI